MRGSSTSEMGRGLRVLTINLRKMVFKQKMKDMSVRNTFAVLGILWGGGDEIMDVDRELGALGPRPGLLDADYLSSPG
jgi:hypothetical protein